MSCTELSYETGQWSIRGLRPKAKRRGDTVHTAYDAPLKCRIDPQQSPYTCGLPQHKPVRRGREMIDPLAVEEPKPKPAKIRAGVVRGSDREVVQTHAVV
jgi:hypothetical protein